MARDWNKMGALGSLGSFILALALFAIQIWPVPQWKAAHPTAQVTGVQSPSAMTSQSTQPTVNPPIVPKSVVFFLIVSLLLASISIYGAWRKPTTATGRASDDELRRVANEDAARMNERLVVMESIADCHFDVPNRYIDLRFRLTNMSVFRVLSPSIEGYLTYRNQPLPNAPQIIGPSFEVGHAETGVLTVRHFVSGEFADEIRAAVGKVSIDFGHAQIFFSFSHESNTFKWSTGEVVIAIRDRGETANELWEQEIAGGEAGTDLRFEALQVTNGIDVNFDETFIFIYARIVSKKPTSILSFTPKIYANGELHDCEHLTNLSGWVWIKESASSKYPFTTTTRDNLEDHSLWRILQKEPLISEVHRAGWIGIKTVKLRTAEPLEAISSMFVTVEDGGSLKHKFNFQPRGRRLKGRLLEPICSSSSEFLVFEIFRGDELEQCIPEEMRILSIVETPRHSVELSNRTSGISLSDGGQGHVQSGNCSLEKGSHERTVVRVEDRRPHAFQGEFVGYTSSQ